MIMKEEEAEGLIKTDGTTARDYVRYEGIN